MIIYVDMDEVVADLNESFEKIIGRSLGLGSKLSDVEFAKIEKYERILRDVKVKEGAEILIEWLREYCQKNNCQLFFLTSIGNERTRNMHYIIYDKVMWASKYFPDIPVFFGPYAEDKWRFCQPGDIIIDDQISICKQWIDVGGKAHVYTTWTECKIWLETELI